MVCTPTSTAFFINLSLIHITSIFTLYTDIHTVYPHIPPKQMCTCDMQTYHVHACVYTLTWDYWDDAATGTTAITGPVYDTVRTIHRFCNVTTKWPGSKLYAEYSP